jgi:enolase-phosphatase E1
VRSPASDNQINVILVDIEGTTTPVDFVYETLFPYARANIDSFLREHSVDQEIVSLIEQLHIQYNYDKRDEKLQVLLPPWIEDNDEMQLRSAVAYFQWLITKDIKHTALKSLEGKIWEEGYNMGEIRGIVYRDVPPAFKRWTKQKRLICIYSSGSVLAQQLLFRTVAYGDLTAYISTFFDTGVGAKTQSESYRKIAESLACSPRNVLFISDTIKEIKAAQEARMRTILCNRDLKTSQLPETNIVIIRSFDEVFPC